MQVITGVALTMEMLPGTQFRVDARPLHAELAIGRDFPTWIADRIKKFQLVVNVDYRVFPGAGENPLGGRPTIEYRLTSPRASWRRT